jgi:hypothetical protein
VLFRIPAAFGCCINPEREAYARQRTFPPLWHHQPPVASFNLFERVTGSVRRSQSFPQPYRDRRGNLHQSSEGKKKKRDLSRSKTCPQTSHAPGLFIEPLKPPAPSTDTTKEDNAKARKVEGKILPVSPQCCSLCKVDSVVALAQSHFPSFYHLQPNSFLLSISLVSSILHLPI